MIRDLLLRFLVSPCQINLAWLPVVLCICGFTFVQVRYYPGYVTIDPFNQFNQVEEGVIIDGNSPVMTYTWKLIRDGYKTITGITILGNGVLWTFYNLLLWGGFYFVLRSGKTFWSNTRQKPRIFIALILLVVFCLSCELINPTKFLGKDLGFLGAYIMATGLLLNFPKDKKFQLLFALGILFFLFYGTAMRHNAVFAVVPLLCWFAWVILPKKNLLITLSAGFVLWILLLSGIHYVNYELIKAVRLYTLSEIFFLDIWHLNARTSNYILPPNTFGNNFTDLNEKTFRDNFIKERLFITGAFSTLSGEAYGKERKYRFGQSSLTLSKNPDKIKLVERINQRRKIFNIDWYQTNVSVGLKEVQTQFPKDYQLLKKAWINRILMDPITYLKFKTQFFSQLCEYDLRYCRASAKKMFLVLGFMLISLFISQNITSQAVFPWLMLILSALFYILPLWLFCPDSTQIRYLYWFFAASFISIAYFLAHSPLFAAILQTVQQYLEKKALSTAIKH